MSDVEKHAKQLLKRMIYTGGFIANGIYEERPRFWRSSNRQSTLLITPSIFRFLIQCNYIKQDYQGRYLITEKGCDFVKPWYLKIFMRM